MGYLYLDPSRRRLDEGPWEPVIARWAFAEPTESDRIASTVEAKVASAFNEMIAPAGGVPPALSA